MKIKKRGFTLIELLITIVIMSLIFSLGFFLISSTLKNAKTSVDDATQKMVLNAAELYTIEFRDSSGWSEGDGNFCVTLDSLINYGYFKNNENKINDLKGEGYYVNITVDTNGVSSYKLTKAADGEYAEELCSYKKTQTTMENQSGSLVIENLGNFTYNTTVGSNGNYNVEIDFPIELQMSQVTKTLPVYVAIVVDNSGSMVSDDGSKFENSRDAAINLSESIISKFGENANIALVQYGDKPILKRSFSSDVLTTSDFYNPGDTTGGGTNTSGGLDMVSSLFTAIDDDNALFYTILLYDGEPAHYSYFTYSGRTLYSTSGNNNYFKYFKDYTTYFKTCSNTDECIKYIKSSSDYLKNTVNSNLITIGYDVAEANVTEAQSKELKIVSTQDNELCASSDYYEEVVTLSETSEDIDVELVSTTSVYPFEVKDGKLVSTNAGINNSRSHSYLKIDLTGKDSQTIKINSTINSVCSMSDNSRNIGYITFSDSPNISTISSVDFLCGIGTIYTSGNNKSIVYGGRTNETYDYEYTLPANQITYVHFVYEKIGYFSSDGEGFTINSVAFEGASSESISESVIKDEDLVQSIFPFEQSGSKLISTNQGVKGSQSYSYEVIDLTDKTGDYVLEVNASISSYYGYNVGYIYVSTTDYSPIVVAEEQRYIHNLSSGTKSKYVYPYNNVCTNENSRCLTGEVSDRNYYFNLTGGNKYYIHFIYDKNYKTSGDDDTFTINSVTLFKSGDSLYSGKVPTTETTTYIGELTTTHTYGFEESGDSIVSTNKEVSSSYSHSYNKIDLSSFSSNDLIEVKINSIVSSEYNDRGNVVISESSDTPDFPIATTSCVGTSSGICLLTTGNNSKATTYSAILSGGKVYYIHYMYSKGSSTNSNNDNFIIQSITLNKVTSDEDTNIDIFDSANYTFEKIDNAYIPNNKGIYNSVAYSYVKIDLSSYSSEDSFMLSINRTISSNVGYGAIIVKDNAENPISSSTSYSSAIEQKVNGNETTDISTSLSGGDVYYVYFVYYRKPGVDIYNDAYTINSINVYSTEESYVDFSNVKLDYVTLENSNNYSFVEEDGKFVNNNSGNDYSFAHGYTEIDLSDYSSSEEFVLDVNATIDSPSGSARYASLILTTTSDIPRIYRGHYTSNMAYFKTENLIDYFGNEIYGQSTEDYTTRINGGETYYLHYVYYSNSSASTTYEKKFTINSVNVYKINNIENNYYCYYDSDSEQISSLFENITNTIVDSIPSTNAKTITISIKTNSDYFNFIDDGTQTDKVVVGPTELTFDDSSSDKVEIEIKENFELKPSSNLANLCESESETACSVDVELFEEITITLGYVDLEPDEIKIDENLPTVKVNVSKIETVN